MTRLEISALNPKSWDNIDPDTPLPLQQHWAYGKALEHFGSKSLKITFFDANNKKIAMALAAQRRFMGILRLTTVFRGPMWLTNVSEEEKALALRELKRHFPKFKWNFLALLPEIHDDKQSIFPLKKAGYRKVMTGFSTAWLDLRPDIETVRKSLKGKWRNQLKKAEGESIEIAIGGRKPHQYSWLLEREADQRGNRRYQATPLGLVPEYVNSGNNPSDMVLSVIASKGKSKIAGALFLIHGNSATYHIGWAGEDARSLNAQNLVLWQGMMALKGKGVRFLDLGGLNTADLAGIARFKLGTGAEPIMLAGAYL
jgi:hypothetical protein